MTRDYGANPSESRRSALVFHLEGCRLQVQRDPLSPRVAPCRRAFLLCLQAGAGRVFARYVARLSMEETRGETLIGRVDRSDALLSFRVITSQNGPRRRDDDGGLHT